MGHIAHRVVYRAFWKVQLGNGMLGDNEDGLLIVIEGNHDLLRRGVDEIRDAHALALSDIDGRIAVHPKNTSPHTRIAGIVPLVVKRIERYA